MTEPVDLGPTGGVVWARPDEWARRRTPQGCVICQSGVPLDVIAELPSAWVTAAREAPLPHYVCVVSRRHVNEPFELTPAEQSRFWLDAMAVAAAVHALAQPIKMNYEVHGNTLPHLHLHLFPRTVDDPYVGGPVDPRRSSFVRTDEQLAAGGRGGADRPCRAGPRVRGPPRRRQGQPRRRGAGDGRGLRGVRGRQRLQRPLRPSGRARAPRRRAGPALSSMPPAGPGSMPPSSSPGAPRSSASIAARPCWTGLDDVSGSVPPCCGRTSGSSCRSSPTRST